MILKNKVFVSTIILIFSFNFTYADNKKELLSSISVLETNLNNLKSNSISDLEQKVSVLINNFDNSFLNLGYDTKSIDYLVSLGKISSNFKTDLVLELSNLKNEILSKINSELTSLNNIKDDVNYKFNTISDNQKATLLARIKVIDDNYKNLSDSFSGKINILNSKYTSNLNSYISNLKQVFETNKDIIKELNDFVKKYEELYSLNLNFEKNYSEFRKNYLSYAGDLTNFSESKQKEYVDILKKELQKIIDLNIEANNSLKNYKSDIDRFLDILVENFENSLFLKIADSYGIIYSETDINSIISRFNTVKNRYFDLDGKLKATEVVNNISQALSELNFLYEKLDEINKKMINLLGDGSVSNTIDNIKIRLENEMIRFYNSNYPNYKEDLKLKIKEKLNITALETKNAILASDAIDLRFSLLNDKISKSNDLVFIQNEIDKFKKDISKYSYLNNDILNTKIKNLDNNLAIFVIQKELSQLKYSKMSSKNYETQLIKILNNLKAKYPGNYRSKLDIVLSRIDNALSYKLTDKNRFMLLVVKLEILKFIK